MVPAGFLGAIPARLMPTGGVAAAEIMRHVAVGPRDEIFAHAWQHACDIA